jgi:hypothetical protein
MRITLAAAGATAAALALAAASAAGEAPEFGVSRREFDVAVGAVIKKEECKGFVPSDNHHAVYKTSEIVMQTRGGGTVMTCTFDVPEHRWPAEDATATQDEFKCVLAPYSLNLFSLDGSLKGAFTAAEATMSVTSEGMAELRCVFPYLSLPSGSAAV